MTSVDFWDHDQHIWGQAAASSHNNTNDGPFRAPVLRQQPPTDYRIPKHETGFKWRHYGSPISRGADRWPADGWVTSECPNKLIYPSTASSSALTADRRLLRRLLFRAKSSSVGRSSAPFGQRRLASKPGINRSFLMKKRFIRASVREGREKGRRPGGLSGKATSGKGPRRVAAWVGSRRETEREETGSQCLGGGRGGTW